MQDFYFTDDFFVKSLNILERVKLFKEIGVKNFEIGNFENWLFKRGTLTIEDFFHMIDVYGISLEDFNLAFAVLSEKQKKVVREKVEKAKWFLCLKEVLDSLNSLKNTDYGYLTISKLFSRWFCEKFLSVNINLENIIINEEVMNKVAYSLDNFLLNIYIKTLIYEYYLWRENNSENIKNKKNVFQLFIHYLLNNKGIYKFMNDYPVIGRTMAQKTLNWLVYFSKVIHDLDKHFTEISKRFEIKSNRITSIEILGDFHQESSAVLIVIFEKSKPILYKPRNSSLQKTVVEFIKWCETKEKKLLDLIFPSLYDGETFTIEEYIPYVECNNEEELERYYRRFGQLCGFVYLLKGSDIHFENLIAHAEYPVIVDMETIVAQENSQKELFRDARYFALKEINESILSSGLIPCMSFVDFKTGKGVDVSAFSGGGQKLPYKTLVLNEKDIDNIKFDYSEIEISEAQNIPKLRGEKVDFRKYVPEVLKGFMTVLEFARIHKGEIIYKIEESFKGNIRSRTLLKNTDNYYKMLSFYSHPSYTQDFLDLERLFANLWVANYKNKIVIRSEIEDLMNFDIPVFYRKLNDNVLEDSHNRKVEGFFINSGFNLIKERIKSIDDETVSKQISILQASLNYFDEKIEKIKGNNLCENAGVIIEENITLQKEILTEEIMEIGNILVENAIWGAKEKSVIWNGLIFDRINNTNVILPLESSLFYGLSGIMLFLSYAFLLVPDENYMKITKTLFYQLFKDVKKRIYIVNQEEEIKRIEDVASILLSLLEVSNIYKGIFSNIKEELLHLVELFFKKLLKNEKTIQSSFILNFLKYCINKYNIEPLMKCKDIYSTFVYDKSTLSTMVKQEKYSNKKYIHYVNFLLDAANICQNKFAFNYIVNNFIEFLEQVDKLVISQNFFELLLVILKICSNEFNKEYFKVYVKRLIYEYIKPFKETDELLKGNSGDIELLLKYSEIFDVDSIMEIIKEKVKYIVFRKKRKGKFSLRSTPQYLPLGLLDGISGIGYTFIRLCYKDAFPIMEFVFPISFTEEEEV
ncbi:type 2 lanthipeptide synthetase LanM [Caldicellulosiruptor sp. DIB 104C]|nr:type 2 lanthipeptide synthetase LanM [Caldicellulosiruptor sp. DIB 104C]